MLSFEKVPRCFAESETQCKIHDGQWNVDRRLKLSEGSFVGYWSCARVPSYWLRCHRTEKSGQIQKSWGRNRTKIRLGEICQISPRHLHSQPKERVEGGLFTEYWLSHQSRSASQEGDENVFSKTGRCSKCGPIRMRRCGKLSLRWPIWEPRMDQQLIRGEIYHRSFLQCALLCLLLCTVTSPLSPRAPIGCLKHSRILSRRIAGSIFMPFQLIRPGNILTAISSPSHAASHLYQLPSHTNGIDQTSQPCF